MKLNSRQLRKTKPNPKNLTAYKRLPIYLVLDRVTDTYNIGSLFRLADAIGAQKLFICGEDVEYPPSSKIHKAAVGTEAWVSWEKSDDTFKIVSDLKKKGVFVLSVEQDKKAVSYKNIASMIKTPIAIVIGHESDGVAEKVLEISDLIVELPMKGINKSFNVWGSAAVIAYKILESI